MKVYNEQSDKLISEQLMIILEKTEIILLIKSFTIPEFARKESVDYDDSIIKIRRKSVRNK